MRSVYDDDDDDDKYCHYNSCLHWSSSSLSWSQNKSVNSLFLFHRSPKIFSPRSSSSTLLKWRRWWLQWQLLLQLLLLLRKTRATRWECKMCVYTFRLLFHIQRGHYDKHTHNLNYYTNPEKGVNGPWCSAAWSWWWLCESEKKST